MKIIRYTILCFKQVLIIPGALLIGIVLLSCNSGTATGSTGSGNADGDNKPASELVVSNIGTIPVTPHNGYTRGYALLSLYNTSAKTLTLDSINLMDSEGESLPLKPVTRYVDARDCLILDSQQHCELKIFSDNTQGYLLQANYKDSSLKPVSAMQLISFAVNLPQNKGIILQGGNLVMSSQMPLNIPVLLTRNFTQLKATLANKPLSLKCSNAYHAGSICTMIINAPDLPPGNLKLNLEGVLAGSLRIIRYPVTVTVTSKLCANLVSSALNPVVNPADGVTTATITLFNNGNAAATRLAISGLTPLVIESSNCGTTLAAGANCSFQVTVSSSVSGQSSVIASYTNATGIKLLSNNVAYLATTQSPAISMVPGGNFNNIVINEGPSYLLVNIVNSGTSSLQNLNFNNINLINSAMYTFAAGTTCMSGQTLAVESSCNMVISYNPTATQSGTAQFNVTGTYSNPDGTTATYASSSVAITYAAITSATFVAVGDFGMVMTSPSGGTGTWTANVNSPFATTTTYANTLFDTGGTYVMTTGSGAIEYSTQNGLFWQGATLSGGGALNASSCSIAYDGTYYYTCGMVSTAFSTPCNTTGHGCILRTTTPASGWTPVAATAAAVVFNDIFYFTNGTNAAYVATVANTTVDSGLVTSTTGSTWTATSSGQVIAVNNNFIPAVFNSSNGNLAAWSSIGYSSSQSITTPATGWSPTTARPAANKVTSAIYQGGTYILAMNSGNIYTATSTTGTYTMRSSNATLLNRVVYASGIGGGAYFAVGNNGVNLSTTNPTGAWTSNTALVTGQATNPQLYGAYYDSSNKLWVTGVNTLLLSTNATSWITPGLHGIVKRGATGGYLGIDNLGNIYSSTNGSIWAQQTNPSSNVLNALTCVNQNLCLAVGNYGTILITTNGTSWTAMTSGTTANLQAIYCPNVVQCIVVGGTGAASSGTVLLFNDSNNTWTVADSSLGTTSLNGVVYYNGNYYAVGNSGTLFISPNGSNWTILSSGTTNNLNAITCTAGLGCAAVGNGGTILYSAFGNAWSAATSATSNDLLAVAANGVFVAVGKGGVLRVSSTGSGTWTTATFPTTSSTTNNLTAVISN